MEEKKKIEAKGSCLCGSVTLSTNSMDTDIGACHCGMCRKWGGGPLLAADCAQDLKIEGEENVKLYDSSEWAQRGFCGNCGTHLFYKLKQNSQYIVSQGVFESPKEAYLGHQIFIDKKPDFYSFSQETKNMTEEEIFSMYQ